MIPSFCNHSLLFLLTHLFAYLFFIQTNHWSLALQGISLHYKRRTVEVIVCRQNIGQIDPSGIHNTLMEIYVYMRMWMRIEKGQFWMDITHLHLVLLFACVWPFIIINLIYEIWRFSGHCVYGLATDHLFHLIELSIHRS